MCAYIIFHVIKQIKYMMQLFKNAYVDNIIIEIIILVNAIVIQITILKNIININRFVIYVQLIANVTNLVVLNV
jgi:hypothetical protein